MGKYIICDSFRGDFIVGNKIVYLNGWTRGLAITPECYYVGVSSHSYPELQGKKEEDSSHPAKIVKLSRSSLKIIDIFFLRERNKSECQIYDIRAVNIKDEGMSDWKPLTLTL
ncbi:MAG: hypothetical protein LWW94_10460 [Candidatus Desulfofervidaceae bacterium]|nr:hypothetical protein [Candidatus Desulfofervidaceae bacterium]